MVSGVQAIMGLVPTIQAAGLAGHNLNVATKKDKTAKDFLGLAVTDIVGLEVIKLESGIIAGL